MSPLTPNRALPGLGRQRGRRRVVCVTWSALLCSAPGPEPTLAVAGEVARQHQTDPRSRRPRACRRFGVTGGPAASCSAGRREAGPACPARCRASASARALARAAQRPHRAQRRQRSRRVRHAAEIVDPSCLAASARPERTVDDLTAEAVRAYRDALECAGRASATLARCAASRRRSVSRLTCAACAPLRVFGRSDVAASRRRQFGCRDRRHPARRSTAA
jgi:hypothetical protein